MKLLELEFLIQKLHIIFDKLSNRAGLNHLVDIGPSIPELAQIHYLIVLTCKDIEESHANIAIVIGELQKIYKDQLAYGFALAFEDTDNPNNYSDEITVEACDKVKNILMFQLFARRQELLQHLNNPASSFKIGYLENNISALNLFYVNFAKAAGRMLRINYVQLLMPDTHIVETKDVLDSATEAFNKLYISKTQLLVLPGMPHALYQELQLFAHRIINSPTLEFRLSILDLLIKIGLKATSLLEYFMSCNPYRNKLYTHQTIYDFIGLLLTNNLSPNHPLSLNKSKLLWRSNTNTRIILEALKNDHVELVGLLLRYKAKLQPFETTQLILSSAMNKTWNKFGLRVFPVEKDDRFRLGIF